MCSTTMKDGFTPPIVLKITIIMWNNLHIEECCFYSGKHMQVFLPQAMMLELCSSLTTVLVPLSSKSVNFFEIRSIEDKGWRGWLDMMAKVQ